jgi:hypothetical protein
LKAHEISDEANGVYGKVNLPSWMRDASAGSQIARMGYTFKTFTHNYLQMVTHMIGDKEYSAAGWALLSPAILAGPSALVGKEVIAALVTIVASIIPGMQPPDDPEEELYRWVGKRFGSRSENFARTGVVGGLTGVDIKGSLGMEINVPTTIPELLGAPYSLAEDFFLGAQNMWRGDFMKGVERMAPRAISSPLRAYREATEGITTHSNQPVFSADGQKLKADKWTDFMRRCMGFSPVTISSATDRQWKERKINSKYSDQREDIYRRIRRFMLDGGDDSLDDSDWGNILLDIERYNARIRSSGFDGMTLITKSTLKRIITKMDTPDKRKKLKESEEITSLSPGSMRRLAKHLGRGRKLINKRSTYNE